MLEPVASRCDIYTISFDRLLNWEYTCYLVVVEDLLKKLCYRLDETNFALRYFTETLWKDADASPRRMIGIAETIRNHPSNWRTVLDMRLPPRTTWIAGRVPPIPQVVPPRMVAKNTQAAAAHAAAVIAKATKPTRLTARQWQLRLAKLEKEQKAAAPDKG
jgi:hypothetical protein